MEENRRSRYSEYTYNRFSSDLNGLMNINTPNKVPVLSHISASSSVDGRLAYRLEQFVNELHEELRISHHIDHYQRIALNNSLMAVDNLIQSLKLHYHDALPLQLYQLINRIAQDFENIIKGAQSRAPSSRSIDKGYHRDHNNHMNAFQSNRSSLLSPSERNLVIRKSSPEQHKQEYDKSESEFEDSF